MAMPGVTLEYPAGSKNTKNKLETTHKKSMPQGQVQESTLDLGSLHWKQGLCWDVNLRPQV